MARWLALVPCLALSWPSTASPAEPVVPEVSAPASRSLGHRLLFWIPNRVFDVLDLVRLRARLGPGLSIGVRATELADLNLGTHAAIFAGLRGPRNEPEIPWPAGIETFAALEVSVASAGSDEGWAGPQYGPLEIGFGTQLMLLGFDVGIEPYDAFDLVMGLLTLDPKGDDF